MPKPVLALPSCLGKQALLLKRHWETSPALWGEMGHASAVRSSFQMGLKFYSLFIDKMINWLSAAQEETREARSRSTATSRARGLETTALEAEAFEMEHLEASMCPAEMAMSEPSGAGEPSGATGDAQARASGSEDALEEATDGTPGSTSGSDSVWSISVQVGRELLGSHSPRVRLQEERRRRRRPGWSRAAG